MMTVLADKNTTEDAEKSARVDDVTDRLADFMELVDQNPGSALYGYIYKNRFHLTGIGTPDATKDRKPAIEFEFVLNDCRCSSCGRAVENATLCRRCLIYI